jgi:antitoxin ParD1/3/4
MATMNIYLPEELKSFVEEETQKKGFSTVSEYVRGLIREEQQRKTERTRIDGLLIEGLDSGSATPMTESDWAEIHREIDRRHPAR